MHENQAGTGHIQGQPKQGGNQQDGWKHRKVKGMERVEADQQDDQRDSNACCQKYIQNIGWQRHDHQGQHTDHRYSDIDIRIFSEIAQLERLYGSTVSHRYNYPSAETKITSRAYMQISCRQNLGISGDKD